jgi:hypothetical protein
VIVGILTGYLQGHGGYQKWLKLNSQCSWSVAGGAMTAHAIIEWLRRLRRGYKFVFVVIAAWAPMILATHT